VEAEVFKEIEDETAQYNEAHVVMLRNQED
jgi:hypothetical protein